MGLFDFFRKNNLKENILDDLYSGLEKIADPSYRIFLESFNLDERAFGEATRFETYVATLFYIDYWMSGNISENIRKKFYELAKVKIIERFSNKLSNTDLSDIVDYRYYEEYSEITMKMGRDWPKSFNNLYEVKLKGTENTDTIRKLSGIKDEGISEWVPKKALFIRDETGSIYKAAKLVKELFAGKSLHSIIQEIEEADLKIKQKFRESGL
ncbi:hypothetical protein KJ599_06595 [bacterium]|nr:hypothetical protein [bacterium]